MGRSAPRLTCRVREARVEAGLSQQALASAVGVSRQALSAVEAGRTVPGTDVALRLASALGRRVETLFVAAPVTSQLVARPVRGSLPRRGARVLVAEIDHAWVARALDERGPAASQAADGVVLSARPGHLDVEQLSEPQVRRDRLVLMGCAPALGLLCARLKETRRVSAAWVHGSSGEALDALEHGEVHVAGIHLRDARSGRFNVPQVQRRFASRKMLIVTFASWEQGLVVAKGNPLRLRRVEDLLRTGLRVVAREPGAGATKLLEQSLAASGAGTLGPPSVRARGHLEVAQAVAQGAADVGVAIRAVALAWDLDFIPLSSERFDLVIPRSLATDPRVERLVDELGTLAFRRELDCVGGYETRESGHVLEPGRELAGTRGAQR